MALAGATSGIGLALAEEYARRGWRVALLGRDPERLAAAVASARTVSPGETVVGVLWDATDPRRSGPAFDEAARALGQIDLLVYVTGLLLGGGPPDYRGDAAARMLEVNALGAMRLLEHAADYMVVAGRGRVAAIGSIAGDRGRRGNPAYGASKAALDAYLEGMRHRLHGTGVGSLDLGDAVVFLGAVDDVVPLYAAADVFVLPACVGGWNMALLEAMAAGLPAVTATDGSVPEPASQATAVLVEDERPEARARS